MADTRKLIENMCELAKHARSYLILSGKDTLWVGITINEIAHILEQHEKLIDDFVGLTVKYQDLKESLSKPDNELVKKIIWVVKKFGSSPNAKLKICKLLKGEK